MDQACGTLAVAPCSPLTGGPSRLSDCFDFAAIASRYANWGIDIAPYYGGEPSVPLWECVETGYRFFHPASMAGESGFYEEVLTKINGDYRQWSGDFQFAYDRIEPGDRVLDVGCGYGYFLDRAAKRTEAIGVEGYEGSQRHCLAKGLDVRLGRLQDHVAELAGSFDLVCAFQLLEHIYDVRDFLAAMVAVTRPGGRIAITVPNNEPYFNRFDKYDPLNLPPHHVGMWDLMSLTAMAERFGLELVDHDYYEVTRRPIVDAYLHGACRLGITTEIPKTPLADKLKIAAAGAITVPMALARLATTGVTARNTIAVLLRKS
jgi:SAM-dependent methyltransferase